MSSKSLIFDIIGRDRGAAAALDKVSNRMLGVGVAGGIAFGAAVLAANEFDAQMSLVQDGTRASAAELELLRDAALDAGARTKFSATQSAAAIDALGRAGVGTTDILNGGLNGALDLAAAGNLDVARAAEIAATAMVQFKLKGQDVPHIADLLAAGAGKAMGTVEDLAQALDQTGVVASQTGLTLEETTGGLASFAAAGLKGSDGGTAFKTMLQRLTPTSAEAKAKMDELGISAYDAQGNFIGLEQFAGNLRESMVDLTPEARNAAMSIIFGSDAVRAASVLYEQGAKGIGTWIDETNDAGYAAESARIQMDNLKGDLEQLGGAFETAMIKQGSGANDVLRTLTQTASGLVSGFAGLPEPVQGAITVLALLTGGALLLTGATLKVIPALEQTRAAMRRLDATGLSLGKRLGKGAGLAGTLLFFAQAASSANATVELTADKASALDAAFQAGGVEDFVEQLDWATWSSDKLRTSLEQFYSGDFTKSQRFAQGIAGAVDGLAFGLTDLDGAYLDNQARFTAWGRQLGTMAESDLKGATKRFAEFVEAAGGGEEGIRLALKAFPDYEAALRTLAGAQGETLTEQELFNLAVGDGAIAAQLMRDKAAENTVNLAGMGDEASVAETKISDLADQIRGFGNTQLDANSAAREFESAVDDAAAAVDRQRAAFEEANGTLEGFAPSLDITTEAGRENAAALDAIAQSANNSAAAILENGGSIDESTAALDRGRQALVDQLAQYGITGEAAQKYIDKLLATPGEISTAVRVSGIELAQQQIDALIANNHKRVIDIITRATMPDLNGSASGSGRPGMALGGAVHGPGAKGVDSVWRLLAPGEHVLTTGDVDALGGQDAVYAWRRGLHDRTAADIATVGRARVADRSVVTGMGTLVAESPISVHVTNRTDMPIRDIITLEIERNGRRQQVALENGYRG
ncbi:phage tail tape measure protein [Agromyces sp. NPDC058136]|uniref:phage tail tape measure protein n=1 Tax=Agromyces sp. NPDC058136 TaxID=3346354 RepID=UPI0036DB7AF1